jgi:hypothetical protein
MNFDATTNRQHLLVAGWGIHAGGGGTRLWRPGFSLELINTKEVVKHVDMIKHWST